MSPEQAEMSSVDGRWIPAATSTAWACCCTNWLTGTTPFDAKELMKAGVDEMRRRIRETEPGAAVESA